MPLHPSRRNRISRPVEKQRDRATQRRIGRANRAHKPTRLPAPQRAPGNRKDVHNRPKLNRRIAPKPRVKRKAAQKPRPALERSKRERTRNARSAQSRPPPHSAMPTAAVLPLRARARSAAGLWSQLQGPQNAKETRTSATTGTSGTTYAVLAQGALLGLGDKYFALPWRALTLDTDKKCFILDVQKERLEKASSCDRDQWPCIPDGHWPSEVHR